MVIRHALLALLSEGPKYGFQLAQEFEAGTGEVWPLNTGQVYTTLQRLERDELVESDDTAENGPQNRYRLTESGRAELEAWLHSPPDTARPPSRRTGDQGARRVARARCRRRRADPDVPPARHRGHAAVHAVEGGRARGRHGLLLVADAEIYRLDAVMRWLDAAEARIRRLPATRRTCCRVRRHGGAAQVGARR